MRNLFVGIDVSMKDFKVQFMDHLGETITKRQRFSNDNPGMESLVQLILEICQANDIDCVMVGLEATSVYSWHLQMGLTSDTRLTPYNCQV
ncbi:transposase, partial [Carboxydocella sp. JDF658]|uniref:IS110 family transposase n=1 Tax=Carboxydocella sp. JDF658 TaxID=1926600 RepID=UPI0009CB0302